MRIQRIIVGSIALLLMGIAPSARAGSDADLIRDAEATLASFKRTDPGIDKFVARSAGYAVFPSVGKGGAGIGGAHGTGVVFAHGGKPIGKLTINQVTIGAQLGGQSYSEIIFFETQKQLAEVEAGKFALAAQASAVALKTGAAATAKFENGVAIFTATKGGLMYEATVGGQKLGFEPLKR
jgi:lipid-binding SYLF domain-containing protein